MMVDAHDARAQIRQIVLELAPIQVPALADDTSLSVDLGYDSLLLVELAVALERHFELDAGDEDDASDVETVADVETRMLVLLDAGSTGGGGR